MDNTQFSDTTSMSMFNDAVFADYAEHDSGDTLPFYEAEGQILSLWDQLNELKLEQCLYEVQPGLTAGAHVLAQENTFADILRKRARK